MKLLSTQLLYLLNQHQTRGNLKALFKYVLFLAAVVLIYAAIFHWIMAGVEKKDHSWITGIYWTLTVMSTLGFGDITFDSDVGRVFSILVLLSGIVLLLIALPFAFIRFFYAPWLEAQIRLRAPRKVPENTRGHVIICRYDTVAQVLTRKLRLFNIPYHVIEPDAAVAAGLYEEGVSVVKGEIDNSTTYAALNASEARMVLANVDDATNTNITLTVREKASEVHVVTIVEDEDSIDILELAGATHVTLSIRNTDPDHPIILTTVDYHDSDGKLLKSYLDKEVKLGAMASTRYVVKESDKSGGSGANFIVRWRSDAKVTEPVIETVMISTSTQQGVSFTSRGQAIKED